MNEVKKNTSDVLLEMDSVKKALKEEAKSTLKTILGDVVKDTLRESIEDNEKDEYEVEEESTEDKEKEEKTEKSGDVSEDLKPEEAPEQPVDNSEMSNAQEAPIQQGEGEETPDELSNYSQYQAGDENTYDLTDEKDINQVLKVYKLMQGDDQVVVKQEGGTIQLTDNGTGAEYVIDLEGEDVPEEEGGEEIAESALNESDEIAGFPEDDEFEIALDDEEPDFELETDEALEDEIDDSEFEPEEDGFEPRLESKKSKKVMKENKQLVFEVDLGFTDDYQGKDPIEGLSNQETSKSGVNWDAGVPTGTEKPWAGPSEKQGQPFGEVTETLDECGDMMSMGEQPMEEGTNVGGAVQQRTSSKSHIPANRKEHGPKVKRHVSAGGEYSEVVESYKKEIAKLKKMNEAYRKENLKLKECAKDLGNTIKESFVVNTNLAKITRLFTENTVSQAEKKEIVNRFANEAKTVEQSNALFETINKELKKANKNITLESTDKSMSVEESKKLNEVKKSQSLLKSLDLIKRMQ